jgi:hypothetical protein
VPGLYSKGGRVRTFLTISVGELARTAKPIIATDDRTAIEAAMAALAARTGVLSLRSLLPCANRDDDAYED